MKMEQRVGGGDNLGSYELLCCVGRGGMATVWAARHHGAHGFSKIVALKTMLPELSEEPDFQRMFLSEGRVAAGVRHPNVVETLDLGEDDGVLYIVMEWIDGETLSAIMKSAFLRGGVPLHIALRLVIDACAGAHAAHELTDDDGKPVGLVHRDVSPPNILVSYTGVVKLTDFGVAKTIDVGNAVTIAGQVKGKMRYMAPEQLLGAALDRRTDIFALGISLYQLTTGRHPWPGDTATVTMQRILSEKPTSPASFVAGYPPELERIVLKALARNPSERFRTAAEMALAIENFARKSISVATTREVGEYVTELLGAHGAARRDALRAAVRDAEVGQRRAHRLTAKHLRVIDASWEPDVLEPANEIVPTPATSLAPIASPSDPPALSDARSSTPGWAQPMLLTATDRPKRALFFGAAAAVVTAFYMSGAHRSPEAAATADAASLPLPASFSTLPPAMTPTSMLELPIASSSSADPVTTAAPAPPHRDIAHRPPLPWPARRPPAAAPKPAPHAIDQEPDVGF